MTHSSKTNLINSSDNSNQESKEKTSSKRSGLFRFIYKTYKYTTILTIIALIVLSGVLILGDTSQQIKENREIFGLYKNSPNFSNSV